MSPVDPRRTPWEVAHIPVPAMDKVHSWDFLLVWWLSIHLPMRGTWVGSLVGELRFHMQGHVLELLSLRPRLRPKAAK